MAKLASHSEEIAKEILLNNIIPDLLKDLENKNRYFKKALSYLIKSMAKHCIEIA